MKVLHIVPAYPPEGLGGIELTTRDLVAAQRELGLDPVVLTGCSEGRATCEVAAERIDGIRVLRLHREDAFSHHFTRLRNDAAERVVDGVLDDEGPDLVHVHHWIRVAGNAVELAARRDVPSVVTLHDLASTCPRGYRQHADGGPCRREVGVESCLPCVPRLEGQSDDELVAGIDALISCARSELGRAAAILAPNAWTADTVSSLGSIERERIEVLPHGYRPRGVAPIPTTPLAIATWGRIGPHKGVDVVLRAFRRAREIGMDPRVALHVFGPIDRPELERELRALAEGAPVRFHGAFSLADVAAVGPGLAVFHPMGLETHGVVLDEAFELGLPAVVSDLGALVERVGAAGRVVPHGDAEALARALVEVAGCDATRRAMRDAVTPPAFGIADHASALDGVYRRVLASG